MVIVLAALLALSEPAAAVPAGQTAYVVDAARSSVTIHVGRAGLLSFAGHTHTVMAPELEGRIVAVPDDIPQSAVALSFLAARLAVLERGEPAGDAPKVQEAMLSPKVLDAARFPAITFQSTAVSGSGMGPGVYRLIVRGSLTLRGVTRPITLPLVVEVGASGLKARGRMILRQTDYGIEPVSVAGVVKVKNDLAVDFAIVGSPLAP